MTLNAEVKRVCWEFCYLTQNGKINENYLKKIEAHVEELGIQTEKEAKKHFREWVKKPRHEKVQRASQ